MISFNEYQENISNNNISGAVGQNILPASLMRASNPMLIGQAHNQSVANIATDGIDQVKQVKPHSMSVHQD